LLSVRAPVGALNIADQSYGIGRGLCAIQLHAALDRAFAWYAFHLMRHQLHAVATGSTYDAVSVADVEAMICPIPPLPEQRAIAATLDRATANLDTLTRKCERLLDALEERRTAIINHAITQGLDPAVAMRNTDMVWLGPIPAHWQVHKLKHIASVAYSNVDKHSQAGEQAVRLCNYVDVYYNDAITDDLDLMPATAAPDEIKAFSLRKGDVIITKDSEMWDDIAVPAYVLSDLHDVLCGYHLALIRPQAQMIDPAYLFRAFLARGIGHQFRRAATGTTRYGLGKLWLENALIPVPPLSEQRAIVAHLSRETAHLDALTAKVHAAIDRLAEYRTALITAAVTGKLNGHF
jgi:type I restriction enzyme S subunit